MYDVHYMYYSIAAHDITTHILYMHIYICLYCRDSMIYIFYENSVHTVIYRTYSTLYDVLIIVLCTRTIYIYTCMYYVALLCTSYDVHRTNSPTTYLVRCTWYIIPTKVNTYMYIYVRIYSDTKRVQEIRCTSVMCSSIVL